MAKRLEFNLLVVGEDNTFKKVISYDYDLEAGLVRYKETVYDIRTGLWVVDMRHIRETNQSPKNPWRGGPTSKNLAPTKMLQFVLCNKVFMERLAQVRELTKNIETKNEQYTHQESLF